MSTLSPVNMRKLPMPIHSSTDEFEDPTTADLFTQISRQMDMDLWFLEAHLQAKR